MRADFERMHQGVKLQLGHAGEGVEIVTMAHREMPLILLQLGHAGEGVEISLCEQVAT